MGSGSDGLIAEGYSELVCGDGKVEGCQNSPHCTQNECIFLSVNYPSIKLIFENCHAPIFNSIKLNGGCNLES